MISETPEVTELVSVLRRFFERDATRNDVRSAVQAACMSMHATGVPPQTMLVELKSAVRAAALAARTAVTSDDLRAANSDLTPWMIEVCFNRPRHGLR